MKHKRGRPRTVNATGTVAFCASDTLQKQIRKAAKSRSVTTSQFVRQTVIDFIAGNRGGTQ